MEERIIKDINNLLTQLFQKMKEAGYEWDANEKELKNIEQKQVITYLDNLPKDNWELIHEFVNKFGRIPKDEDELNVLIEYVLKRQKAALSEEDERFADKIVCAMKSSANGFPQEEAFVDEVDKWLKNKLKSLKERYAWKPSLSQLNALSVVAKGNALDDIEEIKSLYNDLKKL